MRCECGACDLGIDEDAEDDVTQFCIEEATMIAYDLFCNAQAEADKPEPKPGEITDPVMQDAMAKAKQAHFETFGVRV